MGLIVFQLSRRGLRGHGLKATLRNGLEPAKLGGFLFIDDQERAEQSYEGFLQQFPHLWQQPEMGEDLT